MKHYETEQQRLDARRETNRKYYEKTKESRLIKQKLYYQEHQEELNAKSKIRQQNKKRNCNRIIITDDASNSLT
jgi:hypothetical protein